MNGLSMLKMTLKSVDEDDQSIREDEIENFDEDEKNTADVHIDVSFSLVSNDLAVEMIYLFSIQNQFDYQFQVSGTVLV